jgi:hypothetical protein
MKPSEISPLRILARSILPLVLMVVTLVFAAIPRAEQVSCTYSPTGEGPSEGISRADTLRALFVFARHPDASTGAHCGESPLAWVDSSSVPVWADSLFEDTTYAHLRDFTPRIEGSLTHYLWTMSHPDTHVVLLGRAYPSVVVLDTTIKYYDSTYCANSTVGSPYDRSNMEVAEKLAADTSFNFWDFDLDGNGVLDRLIIYYWSPASTSTWPDSNVYYRMNPSSCGGSFEGNAVLWPCDIEITIDDGLVANCDGIGLVPKARSCSGQLYRIRNRWRIMTICAHEIIHGFSDMFTGYGAFGHSGGMGPYCVYSDRVTRAIPSAFTRYRLGWIEPPEFSAASFPPTGKGDTTIVLRDALTCGSDGCAILKTQDNAQFLLLEVRDTTNVYAQNQPDELGLSQCCKLGNNTPGLVVTHAYIRSSEPPNWKFNGKPPCCDVEIASGMFTTGGEVDPIAGWDTMSVYASDPDRHPEWHYVISEANLMRPAEPESSVTYTDVMGPFTNPSTDLYVDDDDTDQSVFSGWTICDVKWAGAGTESMSVSLRYDGSTAPVDADTIWTDMTWDGLVQLTGDVVVPPGVTLTLTENAMVAAAAEMDNTESGLDEEKVELIVLGKIDVQGTIDDSVVLTSSRDDDFAHHFRANDKEDPDEGDWYGVRFKLDAVECTGYGFAYAACEEPISSVEYAEIRNAETGIAVEDLCAPGLKGVQFSNITGDRHIYLDESDTFLASYVTSGDSCIYHDPASWDLEPGTRVVAADTSTNDASWVGTAGKVDLIAQATLNAAGTDGNEVVFAPESPTASAGDDWGGLMLDFPSAGSQLEYAELAYAANPLFLYYPSASTTIENCWIHHFKDYGIWMYGALGDGAVIRENTIERGQGLDTEIGKVGLLINRAPISLVEGNTIEMTDGSDVTAGAGLRVENGYHYCLEYTEIPDTLILRENELLGPNNPGMEDATWSGLHMNWACGIGARDLLVEENTVTHWNNPDGIGMEFDQCIDVQVSCNVVDTCMIDVDLSRTEAAPDSMGPGVRFRSNLMRSTEATGRILRTDNALKMKLGPNAIGKGLNKFLLPDTLMFFIQQNDADTTRTLDARSNEWILNTTSYTLEDSVRAHCRSDAPDSTDPLGRIDLRDMKNSLQIPCLPGGSIARRGPGEEVAPEKGPGVVNLGQSLVRVGVGGELGIVETRLGRPYPTPSRAWARVPFSIASEVPKRATIEVFDIRGRRVGAPMDRFLGKGVYEFTWDGRGADGRRLASGVYFLRFAVGEHQDVRKVVVIH